jgi:hypothetical protein
MEGLLPLWSQAAERWGQRVFPWGNVCFPGTCIDWTQVNLFCPGLMMILVAYQGQSWPVLDFSWHALPKYVPQFLMKYLALKGQIKVSEPILGRVRISRLNNNQVISQTLGYHMEFPGTTRPCVLFASFELSESASVFLRAATSLQALKILPLGGLATRRLEGEHDSL